jgi:hypothetical protein
VIAGHYGAELHFVVVVIIRSFKDWEYYNSWQCDLVLFSKDFEVWGRANKDCILS